MCEFKKRAWLANASMVDWALLGKSPLCCSDFYSIALTFTLKYQSWNPSLMQFLLLQLPQRTVLLCLSCLCFAYSLLLLSLQLLQLFLILDLEKRRLRGRLPHHCHCSSPRQPGALDSLSSACRDHRAPRCRDKRVPCSPVHLWAGGVGGECGGARWGCPGSFLCGTWGWRVCASSCEGGRPCTDRGTPAWSRRGLPCCRGRSAPLCGFPDDILSWWVWRRPRWVRLACSLCGGLSRHSRWPPVISRTLPLSCFSCRSESWPDSRCRAAAWLPCGRRCRSASWCWSAGSWPAAAQSRGGC